MKTNRAVTLALAIIALWFGYAAADQAEIGALKTDAEDMRVLQLALEGERGELRLRADSLSARIDSLKATGSSSDLLGDALRSSLVLEQGLMALGQRLEGLHTRQLQVRQQLRTAYDWEIGVLIRQLSQTPDRGLLQQLIIYQEAREALGDDVEASLRYGEHLDVTSDDGPEEIRQKAGLMEDMAERLNSEALAVARRLRRLQEEFRLQARVQAFTNQMNLFDEDLPEGRVLLAVDGVGAAEGAEVSLEASGDRSGVVEIAAVVARREVAFGERGILSVDVSADDLQLEIRKLKARQQELRQLEALARDRARTFRTYLDQLLTGAE